MKNIQVLIYQPSKSATQSGSYKSGLWFMDFTNYDEQNAKYIFDIMNWIGGLDTLKTIKMSFNTKDDAIRFAQKHNFVYTIQSTQARKIKPKSYASNFV
jgi:hypothetical protein